MYPLAEGRLLCRFVVCGLLLLGVGCGATARIGVLSEALHGDLVDAGVTPADSMAIDPEYLDRLQDALRQELVRCSATSGVEQPKPINILALSGGGMYGAFDVGVLQGWTASGKRPTFDVVTGISTGSLIATFAFLGPKYDDFLKEAYLTLTSEKVYRKKPLASGVFSESLASSKPLKKQIDEAITPEVVKEIAAAHKQGRRLFVGTTNLDTRKLVIWDMGAIAAGEKPGSVELFRTILLASASIPAFFPPVYIDIEVDGKKSREMHVDGGATSSVFIRPFMLHLHPDNPGLRVGSSMYVISSGKLFADPQAVEPKLFSITTNAISSLLYAGTRTDIFYLYNLALHTGMNFQLIAVPQDFTVNPDSLTFDPKELKRLYDLGYRMGATQEGWRNKPPDVDLKEQYLPRTGVELKHRQPEPVREMKKKE